MSMRIAAILVAAIAAFILPVPGQAQTPPLEDVERAAVVLRAATLVRERFYDPVRAERAAQAMRRSLAAGDYAHLRDPADPRRSAFPG
jgi:hypothetical protein